jgi:hypothetical protein
MSQEITPAGYLFLRLTRQEVRLSGTSREWEAGGSETASDRLPKPGLSNYSIS